MNVKEKAKQVAKIIHDHYCKNNLRNLTETAIEMAIEEGINAERAWIACQLGLLTGTTADNQTRSIYIGIAEMINARSKGEETQR